MVQRKKGGGPKTPTGKAIASKNATKHNLRSNKPATPIEQQNIVAYANQLIEHYESNDPLEILQLERIALYREKLATVYQAELAAAQLAYEALENNPQQIVQEMKNLNDVARSRLLEYLDKAQWLLPCGLSVDTLDEICKQVECLDVDLQSNEDLEQYLPALATFLVGYRSYSVDSAAAVSKKLTAVANRLQEIFRQGIKYQVRTDDTLELIMHMRAEIERREQELKEAQGPSALDLHIAKRQAELQARMKFKPKPVVQESTPPIEPFPEMEEVRGNYFYLLSYKKRCIVRSQHFPNLNPLKHCSYKS